MSKVTYSVHLSDDDSTFVEGFGRKADAVKAAIKAKDDTGVDTHILKGGNIVWDSINELTPAETTVCNLCGEEKEASAFGLSMGKPRKRCKACVNATHKLWRDARKEAAADVDDDEVVAADDAELVDA